MSNLEELIEKLCPDGVEYKRLGDIGRISMCKRVLKSQTNSVSGVPFYKIGTFGKQADSYISEELFLDYKSRYPYPKKGDVLISASGTIGRTVIFDGKPSYFQDSNIIWVANNEEFLTNKFLYYIYQTNPWKVADGGTIQRLYNSDLEKIKLPVPPLEVQREIVRILDNFTFLTTELAAELAARQKQYEYYRNSLLTFEDIQKSMIKSIPWVKLDNIIEFKNGKGHEKCINENGQYIVVNSKFISTNGRVKKFSDQQLSPLYNNDILMVMSDLPNGQALAKTYLVKENSLYTLNQRICALTVKNKNYSTKFLFYYLNRNKQLLKYDNGVDQTNLKKGDILTVIVPVISLAEQQRIVDILDRFDALCNDISSGLPAEIEARQKQYEYYRDKLLTFKELKKEA